jgi:hypothetical protein
MPPPLRRIVAFPSSFPSLSLVPDGQVCFGMVFVCALDGCVAAMCTAGCLVKETDRCRLWKKIVGVAGSSYRAIGGWNVNGSVVGWSWSRQDGWLGLRRPSFDFFSARAQAEVAEERCLETSPHQRPETKFEPEELARAHGW